MAIIFDNPHALDDIYGVQHNYLSSLPISVTVDESHSLNQRITDKPVEGGATISDNIILLPTTVKISCILAGDAIAGETLEDKFNALKELRKTREPFTITTSLDVYENMFFSGEIVINRNASNLGAIQFNTTLKQVNIIESVTTTVPAASVAQAQDVKGKRSRSPKVEQGKKTAVKVESAKEEREKSWITGLLG